MSITLTDDQVKKLEASILEIPGKYAIPLLQQINGFIQDNTSVVKAEPKKEPTFDKEYVTESEGP